MKHKINHELTPNKKTEIPKNLLFLDTETYGLPLEPDRIEQHFSLAVLNYVRRNRAGVIIRDKWFTAQNTGDVLKFVLKHTANNTCLYLFTANLWFDLRVSNLYVNLVDDGWDTTCFFGKGLTLIIGMRKGTRSIKMLNIQNFYPFKVAEIGESLGLPKLGINFEQCSLKELEVYCKRDVEIIREAMLKWLSFVQQYDLGSFGKTLASQAFNAYRHRFLPHGIFIHNEKEVIDLERASYFGGRVEAYELGAHQKGEYYLLDVNSMYPYVMSEFKYPTKILGWRNDLPVSELVDYLSDYCVIADVLLETDRNVYPLRYDNKCLFPVGLFRTTLCTKSLKQAVSFKDIKKIYKIALYKKDSIFKEYVSFFYKLKLKAREDNLEMDYTLSKLLLNSLYGKFGQKIDRVVERKKLDKPHFERIPYIDVDTGEQYVDFSYGYEKELLQLDANEGFNSFVAISAHVTDYARWVLYNYMKAAGLANVYYCDTDSLIINKEGYNLLQTELSDYKLGALKLEKASRILYIHGVKDYRFGINLKRKGVRLNAKRLSSNTFKQEYFTGPFADFREGLDKPFAIHKVTKVLTRDYKKGVVKQGGMVRPFVFQYKGGENVCEY